MIILTGFSGHPTAILTPACWPYDLVLALDWVQRNSNEKFFEQCEKQRITNRIIQKDSSHQKITNHVIHKVSYYQGITNQISKKASSYQRITIQIIIHKTSSYEKAHCCHCGRNSDMQIVSSALAVIFIRV